MQNIDLISDLDELKKRNLLIAYEEFRQHSGINISIFQVRNGSLIVKSEQAEWKGQLFNQKELSDKAKSLIRRFTKIPILTRPLTMRFKFEDMTHSYVQQKMKQYKLKHAEIRKVTGMSKEAAEVMLKEGHIIDWCKPILYFYFLMLDTQTHYAQQLGFTANILARKK
ncbi:MAG: hypothetical protein AB8B69_16285 [Chitinophagales bacterium]